MILKKFCSAALLIGGVLCSANLIAQKVDSAFTDVNYVRNSNAWFASKNAAGLKHFTLPQIATAQLYGNKADGNFRNYHQSNNSYNYGLDANSIYRLNPKVVFIGGITYDNFKGRNMAGSALIDPYQTPFDFVEESEANRGTKQQETYTLNAGVSSQITSRFAIGAKANYQAANYAKMKDLRHINKLMDLDASVGGLYQLSAGVEIGLNYNYLRRIESIGFKRFGNKGTESYRVQMNYGSFYGPLQTFDNSVYIDDTSRPLTNIGHGGSIQLNLNLSAKSKLFNEFTYSTRKGQFGASGTSAQIPIEHKSSQYQYTGVLSLTKNNNQQQFKFDARYDDLANWENKLIRVTPPGGVDFALVPVQNERLSGETLNASLGYTLYKDIINNNPTYAFTANASYFKRQQTLNFYPAYRKQTVNSYQVNVGGSKNIFRPKKRYTVGVDAGYGAGSGIARNDGFYVTPSAIEAYDKTNHYLYQEYEYFTKPRVWAGLNLQYTQVISAHATPYAKLNYNFTKAFNTQYLGSTFGVLGAAIGCNF